MGAEESWSRLRSYRNEHRRRTWHPERDRSALGTLVVVELDGSAARWSQSADTDTSPDDAHGGCGGGEDGAWAVGPERVRPPPSTAAEGEDGAGLVAPTEHTVAVRSPAAIQWTDSHSSWRRRRLRHKRAAPGVGPSPAGTVNIRLVRPCSSRPNCTTVAAVRAREFGYSHIADMPPIELHRKDNHYLLCCSWLLVRLSGPGFASTVNL